MTLFAVVATTRHRQPKHPKRATSNPIAATTASATTASATTASASKVPTSTTGGAGTAVGAAPASATGSAPVVCSLFASPGGSDVSGDGSVGSPFASVAKLDQSLAPGQTGCLRQGSYGGVGSWHDLSANGTSSARITISSYPGETATIDGWVDLEGADTTLENVRIDGSNTRYAGPNACGQTNVSQSLTIGAPDDILQYVDYYQSVTALRGNAIGVGFWGNADNTIIRYDKIHDVGSCRGYDHLIYLSHGNNVQIYGNWMWNDPHGRGVQLYPAPTNARVFANVIDAAGEGILFAADSGTTITGNQVFDNIITNSTGLPSNGIPGIAASDSWGGTPGTNNSFYNNDAYNNPAGISQFSAITTYANTTTNPQFTDPTNHNYQLALTSPDTNWGIWNGTLAVG
jgi:hypothetical protein